MSNDKFIVQDGLAINTIEVFTADGILIGPSGNTLNASFEHANAAFDYANTISTGTIDIWSRDQANAAYGEANLAYDLAQSAYNQANTGGGGGTTIAITDDNSTNATEYITFSSSNSGTMSTIYTSSANLTFTPVTGTLGINNLNVTPNTNIGSFTTVISGTSPTVLDSFSNTLYRGAFYQVQMESGGSFHVLNLSVVNSGSSAQINAFGSANNAGSLASFDATVVDGMVNVVITPTTGTTTISYIRHALVKLTVGVPTADLGFVLDPTTSIFDCGFDLDSTTSSFDYGYLS